MESKSRPLRLDNKHRSLERFMDQIDMQLIGSIAPDTVVTGFPSIDRLLGGGLRRGDLVVLGGDVGSGKSALALAIAFRSATAGFPVVFFSGEMDGYRLLERAVAIEGRTQIDEIRTARLSVESRASIGVAAVGLREVPLHCYSLEGQDVETCLEPAWAHDPALVVVDYLQLLPHAAGELPQSEASASLVKQLKKIVQDRNTVLFLVAQLPEHVPARPDPRPTLDDFGSAGAVKQHADAVLALFREEMYRPDSGVEGATELIVAKNRNGPTGFVDLFFYKQWMRFEDMVDPDR
jgi:replicative DNA helicase